VAVLAGGSGLDPAALYRLTGGNPFYVSQAVAAGMNEVPVSARDAVLARAARLGSDSRAVLDAAALIGTRVELALLEPVTGCPPTAIDELLASGLITGDGMALQFRHEIARLAVEGAVAAHRRTAIHARALASLQALGCDDDARMAFHAEAAGDGPAALRHASAAARRAAALASHREAAAQFERALRFTDGPIPPRSAACATASPTRHRCWTTGSRRPAPASGRSACGAMWVTGCARATRSAGWATRCAH
jgi:hypothetical protein